MMKTAMEMVINAARISSFVSKAPGYRVLTRQLLLPFAQCVNSLLRHSAFIRPAFLFMARCRRRKWVGRPRACASSADGCNLGFPWQEIAFVSITVSNLQIAAFAVAQRSQKIADCQFSFRLGI